MSERKIVVPVGMLNVCLDALCERWGYRKEDWSEVSENQRLNSQFLLETALRWLSENPILPTHQQVQEIAQSNVYYTSDVSRWIGEWQRRMFLAVESKIPTAVKDLVVDEWISDDLSITRKQFNRDILEAYQRGKKQATHE